ncbi:MAG: GlsB/YeaQ/YmgE family stress response membrane protein [Saprospiraceae bacterium]
MDLLYFIFLGAIAGWLAGKLTKGKGFGLLGNIVVGIIGAIVGGWTFRLLGISVGGGLGGSILTATAGSVILLFILNKLK